MRTTILLGLCIVAAFPFASGYAAEKGAETVYVSASGSDTTGDGSSSRPWATITMGLDSVQRRKHDPRAAQAPTPGESVCAVQFTSGVTVRCGQRHPTRRHLAPQRSTVITCFDGQGITLEGFDIAHSGSGSQARSSFRCRISSATAGGDDRTSRIVPSGTTSSTTATTTIS